MKRNAISRLIKDIIIAAIFVVPFSFILADYVGPGINAVCLSFFFAGIPFGWRWSSKIITAVSLKGIGLKLLISFFLGWIAIWIVLISDVIRCIASGVGSRKRASRAEMA